MPLGEERKVVLEKYGPYVRSLAAQVRKQFNATLELEELVSYGQVGLLEAADRFDAKGKIVCPGLIDLCDAPESLLHGSGGWRPEMAGVGGRPLL